MAAAIKRAMASFSLLLFMCHLHQFGQQHSKSGHAGAAKGDKHPVQKNGFRPLIFGFRQAGFLVFDVISLR
jgi:hypothetical protein